MTRRAILAIIVAVTAAACERSTELRSTSPETASPSTVGSVVDDATSPDVGRAPSTSVAPPATIDDAPIVAAPSTSDAPIASPACLDGLSTRQRVALLVWPAVYSVAWEQAVATVRDEGVGGVLLMEPDGWGPDDVAVRLAELERAATLGLVIATDEEGGDVQRLRLLGPLPSQRAASEQQSPDAAGAAVAAHAEILRSVGIDVVFGPVVDVVPPSGDVSLNRSRFFTGDAAAVTGYAQAYLDAWSANGIVPVLKHFPGHGTASADTHLGTGVTDPLAALEVSDLVPYRELAGSGAAVMIGHLTVPGLNDDVPATRSREAIRYLRDTLGYGDALVVSDALGMGAVGIGVDEAAVAAVAAGIDVAIFTDTALTGAVIDALERAVADGRLSSERVADAARRVLRITGAADLGCVPG